MTAPIQLHKRIALSSALAVLAFFLMAAATPEPPAAREVVQPAHPHQQSQGTAPSAQTEAIEDVPLKQHARKKKSKTSGKLFQPKSWYVAPPPPPPAPPPPPTAPPLPFTFLGKVEHPGGTLTIFLSSRDRVYLVKEGETIDGIYRVDGIKDGQLALTYLPMQIQQYLNVGDSQ